MLQFLSVIRPCRPTFPGDATPEELAIVGEHFAYLKEKLATGELILAGRTQDETPVGLSILEYPSLEDAQRYIANDPAVMKGVFITEEIRPYHVALMRAVP